MIYEKLRIYSRPLVFGSVLFVVIATKHMIALPLGLHYNHYVSLSVCPSVENASLLNHRFYIDQVLHTNACQHFLTTGMYTSLFDGRGFAEHLSVGCG